MKYSFFWVSPFLLFFLGYFFTHLFLSSNQITIPSVIGKPLIQGISTLSDLGVNVRFLKEKEDACLEEGIILDQLPKAGAKLRANYPVKIIVSKKPEPKKAPAFVGKTINNIKNEAQKHELGLKVYSVHSFDPIRTCVAQSPNPGSHVLRDIVVYISDGISFLSIFPDLIGEFASEAQDFLLGNGIRTELFHKDPVGDNHFCIKCRILEQKPMAGSIIDINKKPRVQLLVG
ncbi:PASTA domain-containing protein [Candidatus Babeliales bacterium]|nr:PASTA domain-containing protein [Candidatus Babeliales bacterium]